MTIKLIFILDQPIGLGGRHPRGRQPRCRQPRGWQPRQRSVGAEAAPIWLWNEVEDWNFAVTDISFQGVEASNGILPQNSTALDYFKLYFTDTPIDLIATETNGYAEQFIEKKKYNLKRYSIVHQCVPTNHDEVHALWGILNLIGIIYKPRLPCTGVMMSCFSLSYLKIWQGIDFTPCQVIVLCRQY